LTSSTSNQQAYLSRILPARLVDRLKKAGLDLTINLRDKTGSAPDGEVLTAIIDEFENAYQSELASGKLAVLGELCAGVSHEARNIMTGVLGFAQVGKEHTNDPKVVLEILSMIEQESVRCVELLSSYLDLGRDREEGFQPVNVGEVVNQAVRLVTSEARKRQCKLEVKLEGDILPVRARPAELRQVFLNLLFNALQAIHEGGKILVRAAPQSDDQVSIEVIDDGPGIPKEIQAKIFEPYFSTKPRGEGTGLGLSLCRKIIDGHGGALTVHSVPGRGASFTIRIAVYRDCPHPLETHQSPKRGE
jgi:signal transduction histidine kinase